MTRTPTHINRRHFLIGGASSLFLLTACAPPQTSFQPSGPGIVDVVIPYGTGGGTDTWGRFITQAMAKRMDDITRFQILNKPGGETITGTNAYVKTGVNDGSYLLVASASTYFQSVLGHKAAEFDFATMEPLAFNGTGAVLWTSDRSGLKDIDQLINSDKPYLFGGMSASGLDMIAVLALEALGAPIKGVFGFEGRGPSRLATQRGETDLDFQTTSTYINQLEPDVEEGKVVPLFSIGIPINGEVVRDPNIPDIPTFDEIYQGLSNKTREQELAYEAFKAFVVPGFYYQKGLWINEGAPEEVIDRYAEVVKELNADDEFTKEADAALGGYELIAGKDARNEFRKALYVRPEIMDYIAKLLLDKYGTAIH